MGPRVIYYTPFFVAAMLIFVVALFTYSRRRARGAWYLIFVCLAASFWAASEGMLYLGLDIETNMLITKFQYLGIVSLPPLALLCGISIFGFESWITRTRLFLLFLIALIIIILVWTNPMHKLVFTTYYTIDSGPFPMLGLKHGLLWWIIILYHYSLIAVLSMVALFRVLNSTSFHRAQAGIILVAVTVVWGFNAVYVSGNSPVPNIDIGPLAFALVAASMAWGFFRYSLLDILPIAKAEVFRGLDDAILVIDEKDRIMDINPAAEVLFGIDVNETIGQETCQFFGDHPQLHGLLGEMKPTEFRVITKGQESVYDIRESVLKDKRGAMRGRVIALRNVTDRKQMEDALRESEKRFRDISYSMADWVWEVDNNGRYTFTSGSVADVLGYSPEELIGKTLFDLMSEDDSRCIGEVFRRIISEKKPIIDLENWNFTKEGKKICLLTNGVPMFDESGGLIGYRGVNKDITESKLAEEERAKLESQLQKAQKMETIGILAGGIAHDLNNVLSGIVSYPELLLLDLPEDSPLRKPLLTIKKSGEQATVVVHDLLTLARRGVVIQDVVNLNHIISEQLKSPEYEKLKLFHPNVDVKTNLEKDLLNIKGSAVHLSKTAMNLISNAAEAMPAGGKIFISTENQYIDRPIKGYASVAEGDYVTVTVSDTGVGISEEDLDRIFEPFYTKKIMRRHGTGLGMAVVWGTVRDHNGYIDVQSTRLKGTTFTLYFPVTREALAIDDPPISIKEYMGKGESILVVDDVEEQREIASGMLKRLGYSVTSVSSGEEAIEYMKDNSVNLLVLDMIMDPGIDGLDTYKKILKLYPKQKAIIASGFSETDRVKKAIKLGAGAYVKKPYVMEKIGIVVKKELEK
jgi:PAS domain S-box-containing protein